MNDINDIYAPIYREPNRIPLIILITLISICVVLLVFFIIKKVRDSKKRDKTIEEIYSDTLKELTSLGSTLNEQHLYCFKDFLSCVFSENYYSKTHEELINNPKLKEINLEEILEVFNNKFYSGLKIDKSIEIKVIESLVEIITQIYNRECEVTND